ncbi:MAG: 23S rRNA pseudouridylate synthase B [Alteromonadaceae bacterium]|nr:MAG: 23S rRNA pseudouridylate synthase B [Alteromonadaceae bacterium]
MRSNNKKPSPQRARGAKNRQQTEAPTTATTPNEQIETEAPPPSGEKLQKVLARAGTGSRREMERAISEGKVEVNGRKAKLGDRVSSSDKIVCNGRYISASERGNDHLRVLLYNKPEGEICSHSDPEGRPSVFDKLPPLKSGRWISVGRLDFNTSGLLLFTTDGELANKLMHPSSNIDREYLVRINGSVDADMLARLKEGVLLEDGVAKFTDIVVRASKGETSNPWFYCVVMEGRTREVRRLWESQEVRVSRLKRVRYGNVFIPSHVRSGQWIDLNDKEIGDIYETAGMKRPAVQTYSAKTIKERERHQRKLRSAPSKQHNPKARPSRRK